ncbi:hypothetical protein H0178_15525 [Cytobacillus firmus]|nr:hypothetical protein [Cytobacillus firmus]
MEKESIIQLINYNIVDCPVYINNSIYEDLINAKVLNHISQKAYAYAYYCLITYLYKNAKYQYHLIKQCDLKAILGFSPDNRKMDFISKKDGLLDKIGYTETITDFPIRIETSKCSILDMYRNARERYNLNLEVSKNYKVKYPIKAFYKDTVSQETGLRNGSNYNTNDCHAFNIEMFLNCVSNKDLGCVGFFIACFLISNLIVHLNLKDNIYNYVFSNRFLSIPLTAVLKNIKSFSVRYLP